MPVKLGKAVSKIFPISEPTEAIAQELQISGEELHHRQTRFKQWNFFGKEREKQISFSATFITMSHWRYKSYEDFKADFGELVSAVKKEFPDAQVSRFGLRYINNIEIPGITAVNAWNQYIDPSLLGVIPFFHNTQQLTRLFHVAELMEDDIRVRFQFGLPNPDYPALIKRPIFVLDLDAYIQVAHDLNEALGYMDNGHVRLQALFEKSITDKLRELMHAKPQQSVQ
jgi:uncharacterized protein (TIGR04255 family)